jgi:hypothetical protein
VHFVGVLVVALRWIIVRLQILAESAARRTQDVILDANDLAADDTTDDAGTTANPVGSSPRSASEPSKCTGNPDRGLYVLKHISRHLAAMAVGAAFASVATAFARAYSLSSVVTT